MQAVAAAVTSVLVRPVSVAPPVAGPGEPASAPGDACEADLVLQLRAARAARRRAKRQRRRAAKVASAAAPGDEEMRPPEDALPEEGALKEAPGVLGPTLLDEEMTEPTISGDPEPKRFRREGDASVPPSTTSCFERHPSPSGCRSASGFSHASAGTVQSRHTVWTDSGESQPPSLPPPREWSRRPADGKAQGKRPQGTARGSGRGRSPGQ